MSWLKAVKTIATAVGKGAVAITKTGVKVGKVAFDIGKATGKVIVPVAKLFIDHPALATAVAGYVIGKNSEDIKEYLMKKKITEDVIDSLKKAGTAYAADRDAMNAVTAALKVNGAMKKLGNHPTYWFDDDRKYSYLNGESKGWDPQAVLKGMVHRNLYVDAGYNAKPEEAWLEPSLADDLYDTYVAFYQRMFEEAPKNKDQVLTSLGSIIDRSYRVMCNAFAIKRRMDMKDLTLFGSKVYANILKPVTPDDLKQMGKLKLMSYAGISYMSKTNANDVLVARGVPAEAVRITDSYTLNYETVSNKKWLEFLGDLVDLPISDNAFNLAEYLYSGVFVDDDREDFYEMYSFTPPPVQGVSVNQLTTNDVKLSAYSYYAGFNDGTYADSTGLRDMTVAALQTSIAEIREMMNSDKAFASLLSGLGLNRDVSIPGAKAPSWTSMLDEKFTRDQMSRTLLLRKADDSFYASLVNATYINARYTTSGKEALRISARDTLNNANYVSRDFFLGDRRILAGATDVSAIATRTSAIPTPRDGLAGELASATKFTGPFASLWVGPILYVNEGGAPYLSQPVYDATAIQGDTDNKLECAPDMLNSLNKGVLSKGFLPFRMGITNVYTLTSSGAKAWMRPTINDTDTLFDIKTVYDPDIILAYQWSNLLLPVRSLKPLIDQLNRLNVHFAV